MSIWKNIWGSVVGGWRTHGINLGGDDGAFAGGSTYATESVTVENALKLSAVWACVGLRASTIASLPLHLRKDMEMAKDHSLYRILHDSPNADMTASEFWEMQAALIDLQGNGYSRIVRSSGRVVSLNPLLDVSVDRRKNGSLWYQSGKDEYPESEILHLKGLTIDGIHGLSVLEFGREVLGAQLEADASARTAFRQGVKTGGFMETGANVITQDQRDKFRRNMAELSKPENAGKWMLLEAGWKPAFAELLKPQDAELLSSRAFGIEEVCRMFRVPPPLIGHTDKSSSWASSLENMNLGFLTYSLRPTLVRIEQAISKKLLTPEERQTIRPKFSVEGLLRANYQTRVAGYTSSLQNGWMSRNEVRALEDLPPIPGGDEYTVQLNMTAVDKLGVEPAKEAP